MYVGRPPYPGALPFNALSGGLRYSNDKLTLSSILNMAQVFPLLKINKYRYFFKINSDLFLSFQEASCWSDDTCACILLRIWYDMHVSSSSYEMTCMYPPHMIWHACILLLIWYDMHVSSSAYDMTCMYACHIIVTSRWSNDKLTLSWILSKKGICLEWIYLFLYSFFQKKILTTKPHAPLMAQYNPDGGRALCTP